MITGFAVLVRLCEACSLTHHDMIRIRERAEKVLHAPANRKGKAHYEHICLTLGIAVSFGGVQAALELPAEKIIHRAKKPDVKALCNG